MDEECSSKKSDLQQTTSKSIAISTISDLAKNLSYTKDEIKSLNNLKKQELNLVENEAFDIIDIMPKVMSFTWFDILLNLFSIGCYLLDVISDIITSYVHYQTKNNTFFILTVIFIIVPTFITSMISLRWYINDSKIKDSFRVSKSRWIIRYIFLFCQMGQILRYIDSLSFGIKYMKKPHVKYYQYMVHEDTDATMLRLFECFLESAPQLLIQLYLIIVMPLNTKNLSTTNFIFYVIFPYFSCCISLFSISLALASYYKSLRMSLPNKINLTMFEMAVQVVWRLFMLSSRILALTLFITVFNEKIVFVLLVHWIIMLIWILSMKTNFCESNLEEFIYDALIAIMFIFCYFNPIDNDTRQRYFFFFILMLIENSILLYFWYQNVDLIFKYKFILVFFYYICFIFGIIIIAYYYLYFHPTKKIKLFRTESNIELNKHKLNFTTRDKQRKRFDEKDWATDEQLKLIINQLKVKNSLDEVDLKQAGKVKQLIHRKKIDNT